MKRARSSSRSRLFVLLVLGASIPALIVMVVARTLGMEGTASTGLFFVVLAIGEAVLLFRYC